MTDELSMTN